MTVRLMKEKFKVDTALMVKKLLIKLSQNLLKNLVVLNIN